MITNNDEMANSEEVRALTAWCDGQEPPSIFQDDAVPAAAVTVAPIKQFFVSSSIVVMFFFMFNRIFAS